VDSRYSLRVAIYARVSTKDKGQDTENQLDQLRAFAERHGSIYQVYTDQESGGKADRSAFKQLVLKAYQHQFDLVVFWRLDRFSREGALATLPEGAQRPGGKLPVLHQALPRLARALRRCDCLHTGYDRRPGLDQDFGEY
jgi:DNA invertase Pin-like site-specific DNA recombinase